MCILHTRRHQRAGKQQLLYLTEIATTLTRETPRELSVTREAKLAAIREQHRGLPLGSGGGWGEGMYVRAGNHLNRPFLVTAGPRLGHAGARVPLCLSRNSLQLWC